MIYDTIEYLTSNTNQRNVMIDLEHFFDGYKYNMNYTLQCCHKAIDAGVSTLVLCDTNGGTLLFLLFLILGFIMILVMYHVSLCLCHEQKASTISYLI